MSRKSGTPTSDQLTCGVCRQNTPHRQVLTWEGGRTVQCKECRLIAVDTGGEGRPAGRRFDADYHELLLRSEGRRLRIFDGEIGKLRPYVPFNGATVLDVGFGSGTFLKAARSRGATVYGLEVNEASLHLAREQDLGNVYLYDGDLAHTELGVVSFDLITFWDSLQCMADPFKQLTEAFGMLRPGGVLVVQVPRHEALSLRYSQALSILHKELARAVLHMPAARFVFSRELAVRVVRLAGFTILDAHGGRLPRILPKRPTSLRALALDACEMGLAWLPVLAGSRGPSFVFARKPTGPEPC